MPVEPRPRKLGRVSEQVKQYLAAAPDAAVDELAWVLDCLNSGDSDCWNRLPMSESRARPGRMTVLLSSGDILVWQPYLDYPDLYAVFYVGPASPFV
ncbi:MAG TPA: hypothetical protein VGX28_13920 [Frankiaceae bacterium]|nr:hypothetical protein [Frankiaceae bacterium]